MLSKKQRKRGKKEKRKGVGKKGRKGVGEKGSEGGRQAEEKKINLNFSNRLQGVHKRKPSEEAHQGLRLGVLCFCVTFWQASVSLSIKWWQTIQDWYRVGLYNLG